MRDYTLKEMAERLDKIDGYDGLAIGVIYNQLRNLQAKNAIVPITNERRGPAIKARSLVLFDDLGLAKARIHSKLTTLGIEARLLRQIDEVIDNAKLQKAIDSPNKKFNLNLYFVCNKGALGAMDYIGGIDTSEKDLGLPDHCEVQIAMSLPLHSLLRGLFE